MTTVSTLEVVDKLRADLRNAAGTLGDREARFLVDAYYSLQHERIEAGNQLRALGENEEPNAVLAWLFDQRATLENELRKALGKYADAHEVGRWSQSITGIGPVISAGLLAHIDITRAPTVGHIWRFAGQDPETKWVGSAAARELVSAAFQAEPNEIEAIRFLARSFKVWPTAIYQKAGLTLLDRDVAAERLIDAGVDDTIVDRAFVEKPIELGAAIELIAEQTEASLTVYTALYGDEKIDRKTLTAALSRRPWNASLKVICWKIGESFVKVQARPSDVYGQVYIARKQLEMERNEAGMFADQAERALAEKKYGKETEARKAYEQGKLPQARIHARAKRYAVKLFLAHWHHVAYMVHYQAEPPKPYIIEHGGHVHFIGPPNWPMA